MTSRLLLQTYLNLPPVRALPHADLSLLVVLVKSLGGIQAAALMMLDSAQNRRDSAQRSVPL